MENIRQAFQGIWSHKMRSFLTMLGIIIGIASIITIVSTIKGTNEQIKENLIGAGNNAVTVRLVQGENNYSYDFSYSPVPDGIIPVTEETRLELAEIPHVLDVSLCLRRDYVEGAFYQNNAYSGSLYGIDSHYFNTVGYRVSYGRDFVPGDYTDCRKVCILDTAAASSMFAGADPVGQTIEIMSESFTVVGVCARTRTSEPEINNIRDYYNYAGNTGGMIFVPDRTWPILYRFDEPQSVILRAESTDDMTRVGQQAEEILTKAQILDRTNDFKFKSENLMEQAEQLQQLSTSSNRQLLWIASISLLVGGIGVMNIMLVTVTERTQEIGLKKAIGARRKRILWQFLTEAAVLTSCGGLLGVGAGIVMARLISSIMGTPTAISVPAILIAVVFSMVIGVAFGLIPAVKASKLNPIQALRRE